MLPPLSARPLAGVLLVAAAPVLFAGAARAEDPAQAPPAIAPDRAAPARAEDPPAAFTIGSRPAWFLTGGVTSGDTPATPARGGYVGRELSLARMHEGRFVGLYGDGYYDLGAGRTYATSGVELGYKFFGVDGGAAARIGGERVEWGPTGRVFVTVGIVSLYGRYAYFHDPLRAGDGQVVQIGGLFKLPFAAWGGR